MAPRPADEQFGFICSQCGECCKNLSEAHNVFLNEVDISRISAFLEMEVCAFKENYLVRHQSKKTQNYDLFRFSAEGSCKFLSDDNHCLIHEVKPFQCANSPFHFFWTGRSGYACTDEIRVPDDHNSTKGDRQFLSQAKRKVD